MQIVVTSIKGGVGKSTVVAGLSQVLDANIIDHDKQGSLTMTSHFSGFNKPVTVKEARKRFSVHDTPPYVTDILRATMKIADLVLIPCKVSYADLLSLNIIAKELRKAKITDKAVIVFNDVDKPLEPTEKNILENFEQNFRDIKKCETMLSHSRDFRKIFSHGLIGGAEKEIKKLVEELKRKKYI